MRPEDVIGKEYMNPRKHRSVLRRIWDKIMRIWQKILVWWIGNRRERKLRCELIRGYNRERLRRMGHGYQPDGPEPDLSNAKMPTVKDTIDQGGYNPALKHKPISRGYQPKAAQDGPIVFPPPPRPITAPEMFAKTKEYTKKVLENAEPRKYTVAEKSGIAKEHDEAPINQLSKSITERLDDIENWMCEVDQRHDHEDDLSHSG